MLLNDIIAILSDSKGSLTDALLKTKVLLHQIGKKELAGWVTNELAGYSDDQPGTVPPYRVVGMSVHGYVTNINWKVEDFLMPIFHFKEDRQTQLTECQFTDSIASIEDIKLKGGRLHRPLPPEFTGQFAKVLTRGTQVHRVWCEINMLQVENILTQVRSRLLDFCLELKGAVGDTPENQLPEKAKEVHAEKLFTTAIYNTGTGTVIVGSTNIQISNQQDDIDGLLAEIAKLGYGAPDLEELKRAVLIDQSKNENPTITDGETGKWYMRALKKVGKGATDFGVDVVTKVIFEALTRYSGGA